MGETANLGLYKGTSGSSTENFNLETMLNENWDKIDAADEENVKQEAGKGLSTNDYNDADKSKVNNLPENTSYITLCEYGTGTLSSGVSSQTVINSFITANTDVQVSATIGTYECSWIVNSYEGYFIIDPVDGSGAPSAESVNVDFNWKAYKKVGDA